MNVMIFPQNAIKFFIGFFLVFALFNSCKKDDNLISSSIPEPLEDTIDQSHRKSNSSENSEVDIDLCNLSPIHRDHIKIESIFTELEDDNGFTLNDGIVLIEVEGVALRLRGVTATFRFCANDRLIAIEGSAFIPSPIDCISFGDGKGAEIGFFTGRFINDRYGLDFTLPDDRAFFVFAMRQNIGVSVCTNLDDPENRPLQLEIPGINFEYLYLLDFTDPFYYIQFGDKKIAESASGIIPFEATQPVPEMEPFACRTYVSGTYPMYGVLQINGHLYTNVPSILSMLASDNPFEFATTEGFKGGINGYFDLSLPIGKDSSLLKELLSFNLPLGEASAALTAEPINGKVETKAFFNTLIEPSNEWLPAFLPAKPYAEMRTKGFVQSDGTFNFLLSGEMGLETAGDNSVINCNGQFLIDNDSLVVRGELEGKNEGWVAIGKVEPTGTDMRIEIPASLTEGLAPDVTADIADLENMIEDLNEQLQEATADLNLELSLRGLREQLPAIINEIRTQMKEGISTGKSKARSIIYGSQLCYKSTVYNYVSGRIDAAARPFYDALNQLEAAVQPELTDSDTRTKLEAALRKMASLRKISVSITYKTKVGKWVGIGRWRKKVCVNYTFRHNFSQEVINNEQAALLLQAADNIQHIAPAEGKVVNLGDQIAELPPIEVIDQLKALPVPVLNAVGYQMKVNPNNLDVPTFQYYVILGGQTYYRDFNPFDWPSIVGLVTDLMEEAL